MRINGNVVAVTGGASGIGFAIAKALVEQGNTVVILGRSEARLAAARAKLPALHTRACDITSEESIRSAFEALVRDFPELNVLVNAAGVSSPCNFAIDPDAIRIAREEIQTNLLGTAMATRIALPFLMARPESALVTVSSGIAFAPHLGEPTHSATKAALHALCRCLRHQLRGTSVKVFEVCPPLTDTALTRNHDGRKVSPDDVARAVIQGLRRDKLEIRISIVKALPLLARISPALAARVVTGSATAR